MSLQTAEDVEPIAKAMKAQPLSKLHLYGAAVDCDETPTITEAAAEALQNALKEHGKSLKIIKLVGHRFESDAAMSAVMTGLQKPFAASRSSTLRTAALVSMEGSLLAN